MGPQRAGAEWVYGDVSELVTSGRREKLRTAFDGRTFALPTCVSGTLLMMGWIQ